MNILSLRDLIVRIIYHPTTRLFRRIRDNTALYRFLTCMSQKKVSVIERFSYDLEVKTREQNRNNKRTEIERFDWFIERIQTRVAFGWLSERSGEKT